MNIVIPRPFNPKANPLPVFVYIHGGSLLYGGANLPIFDSVNLVSHSLLIGLPIICVTFNYRVGLGGFLAGSAIASELAREGLKGSGNFGLTDQQTAFEWVNKYIPFIGGDSENITAVGESAGAISISNQLLAENPPIFHRAICMSGLSVSIPPWTIKQHDSLFHAVCAHFRIDSSDPGVLDKLRDIPQQVLADATPFIQSVPSGTGNPCIDGWFYDEDVDHEDVRVPPHWVKSFMVGDTYHEGIIFHLNLVDGDVDFQHVREVLQSRIEDEEYTDLILQTYNITPGILSSEFFSRVEYMCGDAIFKVPNYLLSQNCAKASHLKGRSYFYHFDQRSRIQNVFEGTAYHAHELLYLYGNLDNKMNDAEREMGREFRSAWIRFTNGLVPWQAHDVQKWMVWGPESKFKLKSEDEDEDIRGYDRMRKILSLGDGTIWKKWIAGVDALVNQRWKLFQNLD